jgi:hypothetical protein
VDGSLIYISKRKKIGGLKMDKGGRVEIESDSRKALCYNGDLNLNFKVNM